MFPPPCPGLPRCQTKPLNDSWLHRNLFDANLWLIRCQINGLTSSEDSDGFTLTHGSLIEVLVDATSELCWESKISCFHVSICKYSPGEVAASVTIDSWLSWLSALGSLSQQCLPHCGERTRHLHLKPENQPITNRPSLWKMIHRYWKKIASKHFCPHRTASSGVSKPFTQFVSFWKPWHLWSNQTTSSLCTVPRQQDSSDDGLDKCFGHPILHQSREIINIHLNCQNSGERDKRESVWEKANERANKNKKNGNKESSKEVKWGRDRETKRQGEGKKERESERVWGLGEI